MAPPEPRVGDLVLYMYPHGVERPAIVYNDRGESYDIFVFSDIPESQEDIKFDNSSLEQQPKNTIRFL